MLDDEPVLGFLSLLPSDPVFVSVDEEEEDDDESDSFVLFDSLLDSSVLAGEP